MKNIINKKGIEFNIGDMKVTVGGIVSGGETCDFLPHFHSEYEFHCVTSGKAEIKTRNTTENICVGDFLIVSPDVFHWTCFNAGFDRFTFIFSLSRISSENGAFSEYEYYSDMFSSAKNIVVGKSEEIQQAVSSITDLLNYKSDLSLHKLKLYFGIIFVKLGEEIDLNFRRIDSARTIESDTAVKKTALRIEIGEYISVNYSSSNILEKLSEHLHMSTRNTTRIVKELFGVSLSKLVLNQRMNYAASCIEETNLSLNQIAQKAGYSDYSTFYRAFKNFYGKSPENFQR